MAARKPIGVQIAEGKTHLSEAEKKAIAETEITMGVLDFTPPPEIKNNVAAMRKWREVTKIYKDARLTVVSNTDNGVIGRYCQLYSEWEELIAERNAIQTIKFPSDDTEELLALTRQAYDAERAKRLWNLMEYIASREALLRIDSAINAKNKAILAVEDRIFLNPAAKVRTLPIKRKEKELDPAGEMGFDV